ncbi:MAG: hypothetical protein OXF68_16745 [Gammaproteobacteria bacterium]|nr:hypothetical protein [Gammaproteobacteria bacterium]
MKHVLGDWLRTMGRDEAQELLSVLDLDGLLRTASDDGVSLSRPERLERRRAAEWLHVAAGGLDGRT